MEDLTMLSNISNSAITANLSARLTREEIYTALGGYPFFFFFFFFFSYHS